ncbi:MAG: VWA domain-containing protein [Candidatus Accumulibacter sp.]|uniref:VWA domain-containing protein n=1 Tax=Candidatus Accumulibacter proximus TaxID=2954385 RepID=A0A935PXT1_9PROT|nr:VWA domain-containing protein [Candidatus Accumulibacter proximus]
MVDTSQSLAQRQRDVQDALQRWVRGMATSDRMAIVTFGDSVQVTDFTDKQADLLAASRLPTNGRRTHLHAALKKAVELARRLDHGLPTRRAIVVLSDGKNDERETGLTIDDVVRELAAAAVPVFALDANPAGKQGSEQHCSETMARIATISHGLCERLGSTPQTVQKSFENMRAAVRRIFIVEATCPECPADGVLRDYRIVIRLGQTVHESKPRQLAIEPPPKAAKGPEVPAVNPPPAEPDKTPWIYWLVGVFLILVLGVLAMWLSMRKTKDQAPTDEPGPADPGMETLPQVPVEPPHPQPTRTPNAVLNFVVVGGSQSGRRYEARLYDRIFLGNGAKCEICIDDDDEVAETQCEFSWVANSVHVRSLAGNLPTIAGGGQLRGSRRIDDRETIRVGRTELRILITRVSAQAS